MGLDAENQGRPGVIAKPILAVVCCNLLMVGCSGPATSSQSDGIPSGTNPQVGSPTPGASGNAAPTLSGFPATQVAANSPYTFRPIASDADGDPLTFSIVGTPSWASFDTLTGRLSGTPTANDVGTTAMITITVTDGRASATLTPFSIVVIASSSSAPPINRAPVIAGVPQPVATAGSSYDFRPTASDPDGDLLRFYVQNAPAWAFVDQSTGRLYGTPTEADIGLVSNVLLSVTDGTAAASLEPFAIRVERSANNPPELSGGLPDTAEVGRLFSFTPSASDVDGDTLTFTVANRPTWASFSSASGQLTGTPGPGDVGIFHNITISVSDGRDSAIVGPLTITVIDGRRGTIALEWAAPTTNTDGSSLVDLAGYRIYYGTSPSALTRSLELTDASLTTYVVPDLAVGSWYFAIRAYNARGFEGPASNVVASGVP